MKCSKAKSLMSEYMDDALETAQSVKIEHHLVECGVCRSELASVRQTRSRGYAYTDVGVVPGTRAIAVPILDHTREPVAAISIAATTARLPAARLAVLVELMKEQAELISRRLAEIDRARAKAKK